jgi:AraC family transcriptional regulator, transcriptional activator of pobA
MVPRHPQRAPAAAAASIPVFSLYGEPLGRPELGTVHVETVAARSRLYDWNIREHLHRDLYQLLAVHRGPVKAWVDGARHALRGPMLAVVPPGTVHAFAFEADTEGLVVTFSAALARELSNASPGLAEFLDRPSALALRRAAIAGSDALALGSMLLRESGRSAPGREAALGGLLSAFLTNALRLTHGNETPAAGTGPRTRELVARFRQAIDQRYREHVGIGEYARTLGCSEAALRKACHRVTGQAPVELVHLRLLLEAQRQLRYTGMSVTQIAYRLGYDDPAYFSRFFSKRMRVSPRAFRREDDAPSSTAR